MSTRWSIRWWSMYGRSWMSEVPQRSGTNKRRRRRSAQVSQVSLVLLVSIVNTRGKSAKAPEVVGLAISHHLISSDLHACIDLRCHLTSCTLLADCMHRHTLLLTLHELEALASS